MSSSPYLPKEIKQYLKTHNIESLIKDAVDQLLKQKKDDPYAFLMTYFGQLSQGNIIVESVNGYEILNNEGYPTIQLVFQVTYKEQKWTCSPQIHFNISNESQTPIYDGDQSRFMGKGMIQAIDLLNKVSLQIAGKSLQDSKIIDGILNQLYINNQNTINVIQPISFALNSILSQLTNQNLYQVLRSSFQHNPSQQLPRLYVNVLQGGKLIGSKCKVFRFVLTIQQEYNQYQNVYQYAQVILSNIKKQLASGKQGEAGVKYHQDGTFICQADTVSDNLKIIENAIEQSQLKDKVGIGLIWMADLFYNSDQKKYELENPKQLLDTDQLIDFYYKLSIDRPMITYMEDPIRSDDNQGWQKLLDHAKVKIGSRKLYSTLEDTQRLTENVTKETHPELSEQDIIESQQKRIILPIVSIRPHEYATFTQLQKHLQYISSKVPIIKKQFQIILIETPTINNYQRYPDRYHRYINY